MNDNNKLLNYKGYYGNVEYSAPDHCFHGKLLGISALVTYEGIDVSTLEESFKDSVDDYLEFCAEKGIVPEKTYSGLFQVRIDPEIHKSLASYAEAHGEKLNTVVVRALDLFVKGA
jgi:predicted HicB family RNase H-like nuclease